MPEFGNNTIDPRAPATPVDHPEIEEIIDLVTGDVLDARTFISGSRYDALIATRVEVKAAIETKNPLYICAHCGTPVYIVASVRKRFFFRHRSEDGSCPAVTRGALTREEIQARKYNGLRESEAHKRIKVLIERSLRADPSFVIESIKTEGRWNSTTDPGHWRKPDVRAVSAEGQFAFEAQLSTTFLDVVAARRTFYQAEGAYLVWILARFEPDYRRMTTDDLLFSNNSNVFVVDDETVAISEERKSFHLRCHYREPFGEGEHINERWCEKIVPFATLSKDLTHQRIFYFDFDAADKRCRNDVEKDLRSAIIDFWTENVSPHFNGDVAKLAQWGELCRRLNQRDVAIPEHPTRDTGFRIMMIAVLSAYAGKPVGWQFSSLIECAHQIAQNHSAILLPFGFALEVSGHKELLEQQDMTGKWKRRTQEIKRCLKARDPEYMPEQSWLPALNFLFPEVGRKIAEFLDRNS